MTITAQASIGTQAAEPLDPQIVDAITEAVRTAMAEAAQTAPATEAAQVAQTSGATDLTPLIFALFGSQALLLVSLVGTILAVARWLDGRRLEDKQDTKEEFGKIREELREIKSWIRWLVALHVGKPVGAITAPPDDADLPELVDLRREASAPQAA